MIEAVVVLPTILFIVIVALELFRCSFISLTTQFVATRVVRDAAIGPSVFDISPYSASSTAYEEYVIEEIRRRSRNLAVSLERSEIDVACIPIGSCLDTAGQPGALVRVLIERPSRVLLFGPLTIRSIAITRNEVWER